MLKRYIAAMLELLPEATDSPAWLAIRSVASMFFSLYEMGSATSASCVLHAGTIPLSSALMAALVATMFSTYGATYTIITKINEGDVS